LKANLLIEQSSGPGFFGHKRCGGAIMANPFVHVELQTTDVEKAKDFYNRLFDWQLEDIPGMEYTMIKVDEGTGG
jgi:predicted enzyme related to lactoylglutathione lyase